MSAYVNDCRVKRVLVDGGASVNICTLKTNCRGAVSGLETSDFAPCITFIKGYDGTAKDSLGTICLEL